MDKKEFQDKTFLDHNGYPRWKDSGKAVHRTMAYSEIYMKDRKKYPLEFLQYQVHHKDGNKENNRIDNLELVEIREHEIKHNIHRYEYSIIKNLIIIGFLSIIWFLYVCWRTNFKLNLIDVIFFATTFIIVVMINHYISKKKKGIKYV